MNKKPNIVMFNPDQWRGDVLGHAGNPAAVTPNIDAMTARDGVSFLHTFCQNPVCTPSRCSFMTGWYPHVRGHRTMYHMLQSDEPMLLKTLKENGYRVWWGGKNDVVSSRNGFDAYCDIKYTPHQAKTLWGTDQDPHWRGDPESDTYYSFYRGRIDTAPGERYYLDGDWANVNGAIDFISSFEGDQPFCIYLPLTYPHPPYGVEDPWYSQIDRQAMPRRTLSPANSQTKSSMMRAIRERQHLQSWSEERWQELRATYYGMCARVDYQFGELMHALRSKGVYDDTAVFFFSDHGDFTGDFGLVEKAQNCMEDCITRVPLVIKPPLGVDVEPGTRTALVELIDVSATIEALVGIQPNHRHFGRSLLPVVAGRTNEHRDAVFCEGGRVLGESEAMELESVAGMDVASDSLYWPRLSVQFEDNGAHSKAIMCRTATHKYVYRLDELDELYDLDSDPREENNRIADPHLSTILRQLQDRLMRFLVETGDVVPWTPDSR